jgi:hypothetical protein
MPGFRVKPGMTAQGYAFQQGRHAGPDPASSALHDFPGFRVKPGMTVLAYWARAGGLDHDYEGTIR